MSNYKEEVMKKLEDYDREIEELTGQLQQIIQELEERPDRDDDVIFHQYLSKMEHLKGRIEKLRIERLSLI